MSDEVATVTSWIKSVVSTSNLARDNLKHDLVLVIFKLKYLLMTDCVPMRPTNLFDI